MKVFAWLVLGVILVSCSKDEVRIETDPLTGYQELTAGSITQLCKSERQSFLDTVDKIAALKPEQVSFDSVVTKFERSRVRFTNKVGYAVFMKDVSPSKEVRDASEECSLENSKIFIDIYAREDLYKAFVQVKEKSKKLEKRDADLLEEFMVNFKRNGLALPEAERRIVGEKKKRLVQVETEFATRLGEWNTTHYLLVTKAELDGLSDAAIGRLKQEGDKYRLTLDEPTYLNFMRTGKNADVRKRLNFLYDTRGGDDNKALLEEAITLRNDIAVKLGYPNHASLVLERRMAKKPENVTKFLEDLVAKLKPHGLADREVLLSYKRKELGKADIQDMNMWDWRYYESMMKKDKHQLDQEAISEYFPSDVVMRGMFDIYQRLLSVKFVEVPNPKVWHPSVKLYRILDGEKLVGHFYMDLIPRDDKYSHAAAFTLIEPYQEDDGSYVKPVSSVVANFNPASGDKPSLLYHDQVETLFHEFGHIMHQTLTKAKYATFSGTSVKQDFVEAPSQMLENWVWNKETLTMMSAHYKTKKPLPDSIITKLIAAKLANAGIFYLRQAAFATLDMQYHVRDKVDSTRIFADAMKNVMLIPAQEGTFGQAAFGHLMGGYDAAYYGYLWSEVYAADMFTRFEKEGLLSPKAGGDYKKWILEKGGEMDPFDLISKFLGRAPNNEAFLKSIGL